MVASAFLGSRLCASVLSLMDEDLAQVVHVDQRAALGALDEMLPVAE